MQSFRRLFLLVLLILFPSLVHGEEGDHKRDLSQRLFHSDPILDHTILKVASEDRVSSIILPKGAWVSEKIYGLPGLKNVGRVAPGIYRGAQPEEDGYTTLKQMGIRTVINLRNAHDERKEVEGAGMHYLEFPMRMFGEVNERSVQYAIKAMSDSSNHPVFLHCKLGQDRTGIVVAVYRLEEHWALKQAEAEMQDYGFNDIWVHLMRYVRNYSKLIEAR